MHTNTNIYVYTGLTCTQSVTIASGLHVRTTAIIYKLIQSQYFLSQQTEWLRDVGMPAKQTLNEKSTLSKTLSEILKISAYITLQPP